MCVDLCLRFGDRGARFQTRDHVNGATAGVTRWLGPRCSSLRLVGTKRRASEERKRKSAGKTPTIFLRDAVHADIAAEDVWIGIEALAPEDVRQDERRFPLIRHSSSVKVRPSAGLTPSVAKKSGEMRMTSILLGRTRFADDFAAVEDRWKGSRTPECCRAARSNW